jgi:hypothetical protein
MPSSPIRKTSAQQSAAKAPSKFGTNSLHFAIWVIVENLLQYERCVINTNNKATFIFADPEGRGGALMNQWLTSDPLVPQKATLEVTRMLRTQMSALQGEAQS